MLFLNPSVDFLPVHLHLGRRFDPELDLPGANFEDGDLHRVPDANVLSQLPSQDQHVWPSFFGPLSGAVKRAEDAIIPRIKSPSLTPRNYHAFHCMSSTSPLTSAILRSIVYYDLFDYPLTAEEAWRWLYPDPALPRELWTQEGVSKELETLVQQKTLGQNGAYFFLAGRESTVDTRTERAVRSTKLWRRAASTARYLELVPGIRMVAVVNTLAIDNVRPESDIDLFIVTSPGMIWMTRFLVTGIVWMLGYRRHGLKIAGRICLSFYITTDALDLASLKSENVDTHFAFWTSQTVPLLNDGIYEKFRDQNTWVTAMLPNAWQWDWKAKLLVPNSGLRSIKQFYEIFFATPIGQWLVHLTRTHQIKKMEKNTESKAKNGTTDVIISEDVLKFHEADRRRENNKRFQERLKVLGLS